MRRIICLVVITLMVASLAFAQKKKVITANLAGLKGTWEGILSFGVVQGETSPAKLEIFNDTVPVKARLTVINVPSQLASRLGIMGGQNLSESDNGIITSQGTLMWAGQQAGNFFEVSLAGEKRLRALYYFRGLRGEATLKKK